MSSIGNSNRRSHERAIEDASQIEKTVELDMLGMEALDTLAKVYHAAGEYEREANVVQKIVLRLSQSLDKDHCTVAVQLHRQARAHQAHGAFASALKCYDRAEEVFRSTCDKLIQIRDLSEKRYPAVNADAGKVYDQLRLLHADIIHDRATLTMVLGDHASAETQLRQAAEIRRSLVGEGHPDFAASMHGAALLCQQRGAYAEAAKLYDQAAEILRNTRGKSDPHYAVILSDQASLLIERGDHSQAEEVLHESLRIMRRGLGPDHPTIAPVLHRLATLYVQAEDGQAAESLFRQAIKLYQKAPGQGHAGLASCLYGFVILLLANRRCAEALRFLRQAETVNDELIRQIFPIGTDGQRLALLVAIRSDLDVLLSAACLHNDSEDACLISLDAVLRRKALGTEALCIQRDVLLEDRFATLRHRSQALNDVRLQLARVELDGPRQDRPESYQGLVEELVERRERLESELARKVPASRLDRHLRDAGRRSLAKRLPKGSVLLEYIRFRRWSRDPLQTTGNSSSDRYAVLVVHAGFPMRVRLVDLGDADQIDRLVGAFRSEIVRQLEDGQDRNMNRLGVCSGQNKPPDYGQVLRVAVFDRLLEEIGDGRRLLIAPDGDLTRLPFEVLPIPEGRHLIDVYSISYINCGRDVSRFGPSNGRSAGRHPSLPVVVADPDFDLIIEEGKMPASTLDARSVGRCSRDLDRHKFHFDRLPATRLEGERISHMLGANLWTDRSATEGRLKAECQSPRVLHIATHGFFLEDQVGRNSGTQDTASAVGMRRLERELLENPLLRSGLAMAGANTWLRAGRLPEEAEDGILTAEDVSGLNLVSTELVVLSACDTGLGEVRVGEGVFGLRQAFVVAGAKTLVMSLWKVPDDQTRELMEDFYRRLLAGEGRAEALRQAQLAMKTKYPDPFCWGAFICQGDPGPLVLPPVRPRRQPAGASVAGIDDDQQGGAA
jgi:CHAT domain-containing protein/tetratricopeptide (TPR) repeat protein